MVRVAVFAYILRKQEQNESHAVHINTDILKELHSRFRPKILGLERGLVVAHTEASREEKPMDG